MAPLCKRRRTLALALLLALRMRRRLWVHPLNQQRRQQGDFYHLVAELRLDTQRHYQYFRMSAKKMDELLSFVGPELRRQSTNYRAAIEPKQRLAVGLRYLASGESMISLASSYRLGCSTVRDCVHMLCEAIEKVMMEQFIPMPTEEVWKEVAQRFWEKWNFPNCLGALNGKHMAIQAPPKSGSQYLDCKTFSVVLLALVDADYRFRFIQVGDFGSTSDGGVYSGSDLGIAMANGNLNVPPDTTLPGAPHLGEIPFVMVGDAAFPLKTYLMRPYPGKNLPQTKRIFNYRLSRVRMVVENAFGILSARWRILLRRINLQPQRVDTLVVAACILHNFLLSPNESQRWLEENEASGQHLEQVRSMGGNRASKAAQNVRDIFNSYFMSAEGSVPWQSRMV
ncbi:protein ALP1-like [Girardinichthys multiradiatus]|uniref:protein ALP1-like n=1 Tax=Girardinichthys multiradiatus TaxID=208333 RepID=UPI001FAC9B20|nr:protein ALP1-like [Girardinichthys multiradiatus]